MAKSSEFKQKIRIDTEFDASAVIKGLNQITSSLKSASADKTIFTGIEDELTRISNLAEKLKNQTVIGFGSKKEIKNFTQGTEELQVSLQNVKSRLQGIIENQDKSFKFQNVEDASKKIQKLQASIGFLQEKLKKSKEEVSNYIKLNNLGLNNQQIRMIDNSVRTQEELLKILKEITAEKEKQINADEQLSNAYSNAKNKLAISSRSDIKGFSISPTNAIVQNDKVSQTDQFRKMNEIFSSVGLQGLQNGKQWNEIVNNITDALRQNNIVLKEEDKILSEVQSKYNQSLSAINSVKMEQSIVNQQFENLNNTVHAIETGTAGIKIFTNQDLTNLNIAETEMSKLKQDIVNMDSTNSLKNFDNKIKETSTDMTTLRENTQKYTTRIEEAGSAQLALTDSISRMSLTVQRLLSVYQIYYKIRQVIQQTFTDVQNLDKAFSSIAMVTNYTVKEMWESYSKYAEMANELGQSTQNAIEASALFYQQGLDTNDALQLTTDTMKLATLAGADFSTATSQMTAALRGFHMEMDQGSHITDVYSELAARAAADVNGIAYAMSKTASMGA